MDRPFYPSNHELWYLINSCLETGPQQVVSTFYAAGGPSGARDPLDFMNYLDRTYLDPNTQSRAVAQLQTLRQRENESLATFLPKFERTMADAGGSNWPATVQISLLEAALTPALKDRLVTVDLPGDYPGWLARVQDIAWKVERITSRPLRRTRSPISRQKDGDGDTPMTGAARPTGVRKKTPARYRRGSSSSADSYRSRRRSTEAQRDRRECFECGEEGHIARNCRKKVEHARRADEPRVAKARPSRSAEKEAGDQLGAPSSSSEYESEKE
ncbi:pol-like protein [Colletotrichum sojae]|uniref:Pol-like protein n=1 Tax=Colletotrichum sojae TaxID=2175907 RepID=A0A8H6ILB5_9PEZI|nr:pol-like protein [Colletotrichum sojae]